MPTPNIFSEAHLTTMRTLYMRMMLQPQEVCDKMNLKFKTDFTVKQVSRAINSRGWSARRKAMVAKLGAAERIRDAQIVRELANAHGKVLDQVVESSRMGLVKAATLMASADNGRTLQLAANATKTLLSTYRAAAGLDTSANARPQGSSYTFNFASTKVEDAASDEEPINVTETAADLDDDAGDADDLDDSDE